MDISPQNHSELSLLAGKFLTFSIGEQQYALDILGVQEIIGATAVTSVPKSPNYFKGMINLRGRVIPVIDIRLKLGLEERRHDERTCFVIANSQLEDHTISIGLIVDTVLEVVHLDESQLQHTPEYGTKVDSTFVKGIGQIEGNIVILLDLETILKGSNVE